MDIAEFNQGDISVVEPNGRIDSLSSRQFGARLVALIEAGAKKILVDLTHAAYVSSAGFRALLVAAKRCEELGCRFGLCGLNSEVAHLFEIAAFNDLFRLYANREEGIAKLSLS